MGIDVSCHLSLELLLRMRWTRFFLFIVLSASDKRSLRLFSGLSCTALLPPHESFTGQHHFTSKRDTLILVLLVLQYQRSWVLIRVLGGKISGSLYEFLLKQHIAERAFLSTLLSTNFFLFSFSFGSFQMKTLWVSTSSNRPKKCIL